MTPEESHAWRPEIGRAGWSTDILPWERDLVPSLPYDVHWVTVGAYRGRSLLFLAEELQKAGKTGALLVGVDPAALERDSNTDFIRNRQAVTGGWPSPHVNVELLQCKSVAAAPLFGDASLDVVFLDGDHSEPAVRLDIPTWLPKVRPGGILAGHDWKEHEFGVRAAVDALLPGRVLAPNSSIWVWRVPAA
jgi:hypothetical protein